MRVTRMEPVRAAALVLAALSMLALRPGVADAGDPKVKVVASVPDLGDMARRIGGDRVQVDVLASGREDLHGVPARPSFIPKLSRADLLLTLGLDAEHSWLPALADEARNQRIREDQTGWIETSRGVAVLDVPTVLSRAEGEQHPEGNPHINIGPQNGAMMARNVADAFSDFDPAGAAEYTRRCDAYVAELEALAQRLRVEGAPLRGVRVISYHADLSYLTEFYGMEIVGTLEPKPGIEPTAGHMARLAEAGRAAGVTMVVYNQAQPAKLAGKFADRIGARPVQIGNMVGALDGVSTWAALQEHNLQALLAALGGGR
ncbi:MAG: zinc ABC transporter substrate-binding protein [bacterium]|nr:zinc ABC transporter substrate-binding protein [bacterium]